MSSSGDHSLAQGLSLEGIVFSTKFIELVKIGLSGLYLKMDWFGNVDDVVFELDGNQLLCYQVKESESDDEITLGYFLNKEGEGSSRKSLLQKFYESYQNLRNKFPNYNIRIFCVTNKFPSSSIRNTPENRNGEKISFSTFMRNVWNPYKSNVFSREQITSNTLYREWIITLKNNLGITLEETWDFIDHFNLEFNISLKRDMSSNEFSKIKRYYDWYILNKYGEPERKEFINTEILRKELGLSVGENIHIFPIDENYYIQRRDLLVFLRNKINELSNGYILLKGFPSTGKSTFIGGEVNSRNLPSCIIFRYLCFHSPNEYISRFRGEYRHFIEDLNEQFFRFLSSDPEENIFQKFTLYLQKLSEYAVNNSKKILIVIDGIDHTSREELGRIATPFYNGLPPPSSLPENIIFLIGGQHFSDLNWLNTENYFEIEISQFNREETKEYIKKHFNLEESFDIPIEIFEKLFFKTLGNPLYLKLICNQFENYNDLKQSIEQKLLRFIDFENNWDNLYEKYWTLFEFNRDIYKKVSGLISRIYPPINANWLISWPESSEIEELLSKFDFLFKKYENLWIFEHNSFRSFLQGKSLEYLGNVNISREIEYYKILADRCSSNSNRIQSWSLIKYLQYSNNLNDANNSRESFITQFRSGRPINDIIEDIRILLSHQINQNQFLEVFRLIFLKLEFEIRSIQFDFEFGNEICFSFNGNSDYVYQNLTEFFFIVLFGGNTSYLYKLNFIYHYLKLIASTPILKGITKEFFQINKFNLLKFDIVINKKEEMFKKWYTVAKILENNTKNIVKDCIEILRFHLREKKENLNHFRIEHLESIESFGLILIKDNEFEALELIYDELKEIIKIDGWKFHPENEFMFSDKYRARVSDTENDPFFSILSLKFNESAKRESDLLIAFLTENEDFLPIFTASNYYLLHKFLFNTNNCTKSEIKAIMRDFPLHFQYQEGELYNQLKYYYKINKILRNSQLSLNLTDLISEEYYSDSKNELYNWERLISEFAISMDQDESKKIVLEILKTIINIKSDEKNFRSSPISFIYISPLPILIKDLFDFICERINIKDWFIAEMKNVFTEFSIFTQLEIINSFLEDDEDLDSSLLKNAIQATKEFFLSSKSHYYYDLPSDLLWKIGDLIFTSLRILEQLREKDSEYYTENIDFFLQIFEVLNFHIQPRKDYQLFFLLNLLKNVIHFYSPNDKNFLDSVSNITKMIDITHRFTERNSIFAVMEQFHGIIASFDSEKAEEIFLLLDVGKLPDERFDSTKSSEFEKEDIIELKKSIIKSNTPLNCLTIIEILDNYLKQSENGYYNRITTSKLFNVLLENENRDIWPILIQELLSRYPYPKQHYSEELIDGLLDFFVENYQPEIDELVIEKARLYPPNHRFFFEVDLESIFSKYPEECFSWCWEALKEYNDNSQKLIASIIHSDYMGYIFLPKITEDNFQDYWQIYYDYIQGLFKMFYELSNDFD